MKKFGICAVLLSMVLFTGCKKDKPAETPTSDDKPVAEAGADGAGETAPVETAEETDAAE